ncbi:Peptidyl-prolyl cis-trans isomerase-like 3 [Bienertia sinuspersici]
MARRQIDSNVGNWASAGLLLLGIVACTLAYLVMSAVLKPRDSIPDFDGIAIAEKEGVSLEREKGGGCCRGIPKLELWGAAVKWGTEHKFNTAEECCNSCKAMCSGKDGPCLCNSWVFCGDRKACGHQFGECWLKKQSDALAPQRQDAGSKVMWTSGLVFGKGEGIIGLETEHGTLHIKLSLVQLHPDSAPFSVEYILELLTLRHCAGCQLYRAEGRGNSWDKKGNHIKEASFGPPYALIQGTLEAAGTSFKKIHGEGCQSVRRGAVAWVGSGPEFFISLANHVEWKQHYTVFGSVLPEDMETLEKIAQLPTKPDVWNSVNVSVLESSKPISIQRIQTDHTH